MDPSPGAREKSRPQSSQAMPYSLRLLCHAAKASGMHRRLQRTAVRLPGSRYIATLECQGPCPPPPALRGLGVGWEWGGRLGRGGSSHRGQEGRPVGSRVQVHHPVHSLNWFGSARQAPGHRGDGSWFWWKCRLFQNDEEGLQPASDPLRLMTPAGPSAFRP